MISMAKMMAILNYGENVAWFDAFGAWKPGEGKSQSKIVFRYTYQYFGEI